MLRVVFKIFKRLRFQAMIFGIFEMANSSGPTLCSPITHQLLERSRGQAFRILGPISITIGVFDIFRYLSKNEESSVRGKISSR
jgi:hypothetical protein